MKEIALAISTLVIAGASHASNPWLEDDGDRFAGISDSSSIATATQPGIGDSYGGNIFEQTVLQGESMVTRTSVRGTGDAYGSPIPNVKNGTLTW